MHREALEIESADCQIMNGKGEWGRNFIPRLQNNPEEEECNAPQNNSQPRAQRRDPEGFTKTPYVNSPEVLDGTSQAHSTHDTFEGQFRQRKRRRIEQTKQEVHHEGSTQTNSNTSQKASSKRPREKHPTGASRT